MNRLLLLASCAAAVTLPPLHGTGRTNSFAIYLTAESVDLRIPSSGKTDWSRVRLADSPLISAADIVHYDFATHTMKLRPEALARIPRPPVSGRHFVVTANGERIYLGVFTTCLSSMAFEVPSIVVDGRLIDTNQAPDSSSPIDAVYSSVTAPGASHCPERP